MGNQFSNHHAIHGENPRAFNGHVPCCFFDITRGFFHPWNPIQPPFSYGFSHEIPFNHDFPMGFPMKSHSTTIFLWVFPWNPIQPPFSYGFPMKSHSTTIFLWVFPLNPIQPPFSYGFSYGFPIVFPWISHNFPCRSSQPIRGTCTEHRPAAVLNGGGIPDADATVGIAREDGLVDGWMDIN